TLPHVLGRGVSVEQSDGPIRSDLEVAAEATEVLERNRSVSTGRTGAGGSDGRAVEDDSELVRDHPRSTPGNGLWVDAAHGPSIAGAVDSTGPTVTDVTADARSDDIVPFRIEVPEEQLDDLV